MAHLFKPKYTQKVPEKAERFVRDGKPMVRWIGKGAKKMEAQLSPDGTRCTVETGKWWIEYYDHLGKRCAVSAFYDRMASERKMLDIRTRIERIRSGDLSPTAETAFRADLDSLLEKWRKSIASSGCTEEHAKLYKTRVRTLLELSQVLNVAQITKDAIESGIEELHANGTAKATSRATKSRRRHISATTCNHYLSAAKAFVSWLVDKGYLTSDPISRIKPFPEGTDEQAERRSLLPEEFARLLAAAYSGPEESGLSGPDRSFLYLTAAYTGLRRSELASLTRASFRIADSVIDLRKKDSKNRKGATQAMPAGLVEQLSKWLASRPSKELWPGKWPTGRYAAQMLRRDMVAAGIPIVDEVGRHFDFHALRGQYCTSLARAGVPIQHAQKLMRHCTPLLTIKHYTKLGDAELAAQANRLIPESLTANLTAEFAETDKNLTKETLS